MNGCILKQNLEGRWRFVLEQKPNKLRRVFFFFLANLKYYRQKKQLSVYTNVMWLSELGGPTKTAKKQSVNEKKSLSDSSRKKSFKLKWRPVKTRTVKKKQEWGAELVRRYFFHSNQMKSTEMFLLFFGRQNKSRHKVGMSD